MAEVTNYSVVMEGIDKAIAGLKQMNEELDRGLKIGRNHADRLNSLNGRIETIAKSFNDASGDVKAFLSGIAETSDSILEADTLFNQFVQTYKRSLAAGGNSAKAFATASKKVSTALRESKEAAEALAKAERELAEAQQAVNSTSSKQSKKKSRKSATPDPEDSLTNFASLDRDLDSIIEGYINKQDKRRKKEIDDERFLRSTMIQEKINEVEAKEKLDKRLQQSAEKLAQDYEKLFKSPASARQQKQIATMIDVVGEKETLEELVRSYEKFKAAQSAFTSKKSIEQGRDIEEAEFLFGGVDQRKQVEDFDKLLDEVNANESKRKKDLDKEEQSRLKKKRQDEDDLAEFIYTNESIRLKKVQERYNEEFALAKKFLDFEQKLKSGAVSKNQISNRGASDFVDISQGQQITQNASGLLASEIDKYRASLDQAALAQKRLADAARETDKTTKEFTLSWQTMGRIVVAQMFNEVFFGLQNAIRTSIKDAEELYKAIAEIQTIVERTSATANNFTSAMATVLQVSSEINFTPQDTANAFYETLSNQIGDNVNQIRAFIEEAGNLGKVTRATLADSADAITAVMNSYNVGIEDANKISSQLFTMVDQGRLKLEEVANHMGNVSVPASQLGVDFDNVVGSLSAISIAGIPARESMTLLRNVMFKLIDPTEAMTDLFAEWGFSGADAAVAALGLNGVIERLGQEALKGNDRVAELMGTIRGTRGVLGLTSANFRKYTEALEQSQNAQSEYNKIVEEYLNNPGEKFSKLIQQVKNEVLELGLVIVSLTSNVTSFFGKTEEGNYRLAEMAGWLAKIAVVGGAAGAAFLTAATIAGAIANIGAIVGLITPIGAAFAGISAAVVLAGGTIAALAETSEQQFARISAAATKANQDIGKGFSEKLSEDFQASEKAIDDSLKNILVKSSTTFAKLQEDIEKIGASDALEDTTERLERMINALGGSKSDQTLAMIFNSAEENAYAFGDGVRYTTEELNKFSDAESKVVDEAQQAIDKLKQQRDAVLDLVSANRLNLAQSITERNIASLDPSRRGQAQFAAAQDAARQAANVSDPEESKRLFEIARKFLSDAESSAFSTGFFGDIQRHTQFFNQQEAALNAAQEQRLSQEVKMIDQQEQLITQEGIRAEEARKGYEIELARRDLLVEEYQLTLAIVKEYQRKATQINTNPDLTKDERIAARVKLDEQAGNISNIVKMDPDSVAAIELAIKSGILEATQAQGLIEENALVSADKLREDAAKTLETERQEMISTLKEAGTQFTKAAESIRENVKSAGSSASFGLAFSQGLAPASSNQSDFVKSVIENQKVLTSIDQLIQEFNEAREASEVEDTDPNVFRKQLVDFQQRLEEIAFNSQDLPKQVVDAVKEFSVVLDNFDIREDRLPEFENFLGLKTKEFNEAVEKFSKTVESSDDTIAKAASSEEEEGTGSEYDSERLINFLDTNFIKLFNILSPKEQQQQLAPQNNVQVVNIGQDQQAVIAQEKATAQQQQQVVELQRQAALAQKQVADQQIMSYEQRKGLIGGQQANEVMGPTLRGPLINGRPASEFIGGPSQNQVNQGGFINGIRADYLLPDIQNGVSAGAQEAIPTAMQQGSQSIYEAIVAGAQQIANATKYNAEFGFKGNNYFATGGPVGTDTIPAWLSPGEYVVNARATAQNFNWLQAINAGARPRYYAEGGPVSQSQSFTNTFNVVSSNPNAQVNNIVGAIRRQISQGKATLSKRRPY